MGIITAIEGQKQNRRRYNIFIGGKYAFAVHEDIIVKFNMLNRIGTDISDEVIAEITQEEEKQKAFNYAILLLSYRARSTKEITSRLRDKGIMIDVINETIENLKKIGYIDDVEFAKVLIRDRQRIKKTGKNLIKQELLHKGISKQIINELVEGTADDNDEYERAKDLATKKIYSYRKDDQMSRQRKLYGFLIRKGYSYDVASQVVKELIFVDIEDN